MISMSTANSIRQLWREGDNVTQISKKTGVCRDTVYKYRDMEDMSPKLPMKRGARSKLDPYKPLIDQWLEDDLKCNRKQRHTARRVHDRLVEEQGADVSISTVERYVKEAKAALGRQRDSYLDLTWAPGEAQADFGETDAYVRGIRARLSYFAMTFPFSNVGLVQMFPGENAECVCQALRNMFEFLGGVPTKIVFDNAAGVGRRVGDMVRTTDLFERCSAHYGFRFRFCNVHSGNEKGNVENKVGAVRRNLFVPMPQIWDMDAYNSRLLERSLAMARKPHWIKGEPEIQLFEEDRFALMGMPAKPFECVSYRFPTSDRKGKIRLDGNHWYSTDPSFARQVLTAAMGATTVVVFDSAGTFICEHPRAYGKAPTDTTDPASQLGALACRIGGWENSKVRAALPDGIRAHMDSLGKDELRAEVRVMRDQASTSGWAATVQAVSMAYAATGRIDEASVAVAAARATSGSIDYDEPTDLSVYDKIMGVAR